MDEIAEQSGFSKPLLYSYFNSKEGLYGACLELVGRELRDGVRGAASPDTSPTERLRMAIDAFFAFVEKRRNGWEILYSEAATAGGPLADEVTDLRNHFVAEVRDFLEVREASLDGSSPSLALDALAHAIVGASESLANWWPGHPEVRRDVLAEWLLGFARTGLPQTADPHLTGG